MNTDLAHADAAFDAAKARRDDARARAISEYLAEGLSIRTVADRMGLDKSTVHRIAGKTAGNNPDTWSRGNFMQTYTGHQFYPLDPRQDEIHILDIAHSLSMQCRYNGHVHTFMSVAEHCVLMSRLVSPENALWALLHDATEAYVGDMVRPLKLHMPEYRAVEDKIMLAIAEKFDIEPEMPAEVHAADTRILLDERAALLGTPAGDWGLSDIEPFGVEIPAWSPTEARPEYLQRFLELTGENTPWDDA